MTIADWQRIVVVASALLAMVVIHSVQRERKFRALQRRWDALREVALRGATALRETGGDMIARRYTTLPPIRDAMGDEASCDSCARYSAKVFSGESDPTSGKCFRGWPSNPTPEWVRSTQTCALWKQDEDADAGPDRAVRGPAFVESK